MALDESEKSIGLFFSMQSKQDCIMNKLDNAEEVGRFLGQTHQKNAKTRLMQIQEEIPIV